MKAGVSKQELIKSLEATVKLTREDVESLELKDLDTVIIHFKNGIKKPVNIACDSGMAIIRDVARHIE